ncbi:hypothetical protein ACNKHT_14620 [Shigella flexneri]
MSANTNYYSLRFPSGKVPMQQLLKILLTAYKFGVKTLYYQYTRDGAKTRRTMGAVNPVTTAAKAAHVDLIIPQLCTTSPQLLAGRLAGSSGCGRGLG